MNYVANCIFGKSRQDRKLLGMMRNSIVLTYFKAVWVNTGTHRHGNDTCNTINMGVVARGSYKRLPRPTGCTTNGIEIQQGSDMCKAK